MLLNSNIRRAKTTQIFSLTQPRLEINSLSIVIFANASFANNDFTNQLVFFVLLTHASNRVNFLHYTSYKSKRIVLSVLGGETYTFSDAFDFVFLLHHDLENRVNRRLPLTLLTDFEMSP